MGAPTLWAFPFGESRTEDGEPLALVREEEPEILDIVKPEHLAAHDRPFATL